MISLVFHGAEVFDSGDAARLIALLHPGSCIVAGIMARAAADESGLPIRHDGRKPSEILAEYRDGRVILIHRAKNEPSAHRFGSLIASHMQDQELVMIDPGTGLIFTWGMIDLLFCREVSRLTGYPVRPGTRHREDLPHLRSIGGCLPGEPVFMNGIIIGHATGEEAVITTRNGTLEAVSGICLKNPGSRNWCGVDFLISGLHGVKAGM